jgi:hypothetical protein
MTCRKPYSQKDTDNENKNVLSEKDNPYTPKENHTQKQGHTSKQSPYLAKTTDNTPKIAHTAKLSPYSSISAYTLKDSPYTELCLPDGQFLLIDNNFFLDIGNGFKLQI